MFEVDRHQICSTDPWDSNRARDVAIAEFQSGQAHLKARYWRNFGEDIIGPTSLYQGAFGVLWAMHYLSHALDMELEFSAPEMALEIFEDFERYEALAFARVVENPTASYYVGRSGALNVLQKVAPEKYSSYQAELIEIARSNLANPSLEILWGGSGSILPILNNLERAPNDESLATLFVEQLEFLKSQLVHAEDFDCEVWIQDLYGATPRLTGAAHGFFGNVYPFLRGQDYLPESRHQWLLDLVTDTLLKTATVEGDLANWQSNLDGIDRGRPAFMVQWCHGAPGVIQSVNHIPVGYSEELDNLLLKAGRTIWQAGPLNKGLGLCHGTDGNGYSLLKLFERTGDELWLNRARAFAMHGIQQRRDLPGAWEGDSILPLYLLACESGSANVPLWDFV